MVLQFLYIRRFYFSKIRKFLNKMYYTKQEELKYVNKYVFFRKSINNGKKKKLALLYIYYQFLHNFWIIPALGLYAAKKRS